MRQAERASETEHSMQRNMHRQQSDLHMSDTVMFSLLLAHRMQRTLILCRRHC